MNTQKRNKDGILVGRGIEWTDYTWNPVAGYFHGCVWIMPNGKQAECYAKSCVEAVARNSYTQGFEHHYFHLERLNEPLVLKTPSKIFLDSMSDLMGRWVPAEEVKSILRVVNSASFFLIQLEKLEYGKIPL